eukprot:768088-Hanusia_phi.AAC.3
MAWVKVSVVPLVPVRTALRTGFIGSLIPGLASCSLVSFQQKISPANRLLIRFFVTKKDVMLASARFANMTTELASTGMRVSPISLQHVIYCITMAKHRTWSRE